MTEHDLGASLPLATGAYDQRYVFHALVPGGMNDGLLQNLTGVLGTRPCLVLDEESLF